ncbi:Ig-like domain-containing protein, partial [Desulfobacterales bacterium HSG16]|nr:Ig-like domain-containing protein [Desulfobacterales bacterium HSG16]
QLSVVTDLDTPIGISLSDLIVTDPDNTYPADFTLTIESWTNCSISDDIVTPDSGFTGVLTLQVMVNDGEDNSEPFSFDITVKGKNTPPEFTSEPVVTATEDQPYAYSVTVLDPDTDDAVTISASSVPGWLTLLDNGDGTAILSGTPEDKDTESSEVVLEAVDKKGDKASQSFTISVTPVNDAPVITGNKKLTTQESISLTISINDLIVEDIDNLFPDGFTLKLNGGNNYSFSNDTITPETGFTGTLTVPITVNDGGLDSNVFELSVTVTETKEQRKISGTVTNLKKDKEIAINAVSSSLDFNKSVNLRGTGETALTYVIEDLDAAADYLVEINSSDYPYQAIEGVDILDSDAAGIDFTLTSPDGSISGVVIFPPGAEVGETVTILANSESTGSEGSVDVSSGDSEVSYTISELLDADDYIVSAWSDKYVRQYYSESEDKESATPVDTSSDGAKAVNFTLDSGAFISGSISGEDLSDVRVEAWSDSTSSGGGGAASADGSYKIEGLKKADDFKVSAAYPQGTPLFYANDKAVGDKALAALVSTMNESPDSINIALPEMAAITGIISDESGAPVAGVWVDAQSESGLDGGGGSFSDNDGTYEIKSLPGDLLYIVKAMPGSSLSYGPQEKEGISPGGDSVDFILEKIDTFTLSGQIMGSDGNLVPDVQVEVSSSSPEFFETVGSTSDSYAIQGLPEAENYTIKAYPPQSSSYAVFTRSGVSITGDTAFNIVLAASSAIIRGRILDENGEP